MKTENMNKIRLAAPATIEVGDIVIMECPKRRTFWEWLCRKPPQMVPKQYQCVRKTSSRDEKHE